MTGIAPVGGADAVDDGRQHIGQFGADDQESFGVGLGRGDLQQRHQLAGGGQAVLDQAVVRQLGQLLDPDAGCSQDLHGGPGPEREVFFHAQVASAAGAGVIGPDLVGGAGGDRAGQGLPVDGDRLARAGVAGGGQQFCGGGAPLVDGAHQHWEHG